MCIFYKVSFVTHSHCVVQSNVPGQASVAKSLSPSWHIHISRRRFDKLNMHRWWRSLWLKMTLKLAVYDKMGVIKPFGLNSQIMLCHKLWVCDHYQISPSASKRASEWLRHKKRENKAKNHQWVCVYITMTLSHPVWPLSTPAFVIKTVLWQLKGEKTFF
jgi:hypothetical protein